MSLPMHCPLCSSDHKAQEVVTPHVYGGRLGQAFFKCQICSVIYMHPGLAPEEEQKFYVAEFEKFMAGRAGTAGGWEKPERHVEMNTPNIKRRLLYILPRASKSARILEVGCSSGFMLYPLVEQGHTCIGVEPSGIFGEFVRSRGVPCYDSFDDYKRGPDAGVDLDVVMHFFVLEHVADPFEFLKGQIELLRPGGVLIFEIPNAADPLYSLYDIPEFERFYWSVAHHWYFTEESLRYLLDKIGLPYEILLDQRYDLSNHLTWARDGRPGGAGRFTEVLGQEIEDNYRQALIRARRCDTLVGVIRRPEEAA